MPRMRKKLFGHFASLASLTVLACTLPAGPASAEMATIDSYPLQQANIDLLAGQLVDRGMVKAGDILFVPSPADATGETHFLYDVLVSGLLRRGVVVTVREASAKKALQYRWVRFPGETLQIQAVDINGRPDPAFKIRNRLLCQVVDLSTGAVLASDFLMADTRPFGEAGASAVMVHASGAAASETLSLPDVSLQEAAWEPKDEHGLGASLSWVAGSGVSYRRWWKNGFGLQVAAVPLLSLQDSNLTGLMNIGIQGMGPIVHNRVFRAFWLLGYGVAFDRGVFYRNVSQDGTLSSAYRLDQGIAPGVGLDWMIAPNLALHGAIGYTVSFSGTTESGSLQLRPGFAPGVALGSYFYF